MITAQQIRMARAALGWKVSDLADRAEVGAATINRLEAGRSGNRATLAAIQRAFEAVGLRFGEEGQSVFTELGFARLRIAERILLERYMAHVMEHTGTSQLEKPLLDFGALTEDDLRELREVEKDARVLCAPKS